MSEIEYIVDEHDLVAFNDYHAAHSPALRSSLRRNRWIWPAIFAGLSVAAALVTHSWFLPTYFLFFAIVWPIVIPTWTARRRRRTYLAMYAEGRNIGVFGKQLLRTEPESLFNSSEQGETRLKWDSIERVAETPSHLFIYVGALMAFVVPKARVYRGDLQVFVTEVRELVRAAA